MATHDYGLTPEMQEKVRAAAVIPNEPKGTWPRGITLKQHNSDAIDALAHGRGNGRCYHSDPDNSGDWSAKNGAVTTTRMIGEMATSRSPSGRPEAPEKARQQWRAFFVARSLRPNRPTRPDRG